MKNIQTIIVACTLMLMSMSTSVISDSSNFAGPYIGLQGSTIGAGVAGRQSGGVDDVNESTTADAGKTGVAAGYEAGYAIPIGSMFLLDIGGTFIDGAVSLRSGGTDTGSSEDVKFVVSDFYSLYAAPTLVLSDTSSLYVKYASSQASVDVTGDITDPGNLQGTTIAVGTRTVLDSGIFIRAEAGMTDYNAITSNGKGTIVSATGTPGGISTTKSFNADADMAFGAVSLGFRF
jgi:hypothetical protein